MQQRPRLPFFTDNCVADSVGKAILAHGHDLTRLREVMARDTKDPIVALVCMESSHILVSHDTDFREIARRIQTTQKQYQKLLHRVDLRCEEPNAAGRIAEAMPLLEAEWLLATARNLPMVVEIRDSTILLRR